MKKLAVLVFTFMLAGCLSVAPKFPDLPNDIAQACPDLQQADQSQEMSKLVDTVVQNYGSYYECRVKIDAFIEWHKQQKEVYNKAIK